MAVSQLVELGAALDALLPTLLHLAIFKHLIIILCGGVAAWGAVPARLACGIRAIKTLLARVQRAVIGTAVAALLALASARPPQKMCGEYAVVTVQGACAMLALAVVATCRRVLSSAFAISALVAVSDRSPIVLALTVAATGTLLLDNTRAAALPLAALAIVCVAYAATCHTEDAILRRTNAAVLGLAIMGTTTSVALFASFCSCAYRRALTALSWLGRAPRTIRKRLRRNGSSDPKHTSPECSPSASSGPQSPSPAGADSLARRTPTTPTRPPSPALGV